MEGREETDRASTQRHGQVPRVNVAISPAVRSYLRLADRTVALSFEARSVTSVPSVSLNSVPSVGLPS